MEFEEQSGQSSWASRRKNIYLLVVVFFVTFILSIFFWRFWYQGPDCFDGLKNGDEEGVDCGGSCSLICRADVIDPIILWDPRLFEIQKGIWNALVYVENANIDTKAVYVPYFLTLYDENNKVLAKRENATILPNNKTVGIFEGGINIEGGFKPRRAVFELGSDIIWEKVKEEESIIVSHSAILRSETTPRVEAKVRNNSLKDIKNIELVIAIFDGSENAIAASRTFIENLAKDDESEVLFTWPQPFSLKEKFCEKPSDSVLAIDLSGSMISLGGNPPEPLQSVKNAASYFFKALGLTDRAGLVSFANDARSESLLISDFNLLSSKVNDLEVATSTTQYTNIAEAIKLSAETFFLSEKLSNSQKIIILLTDGVATRPSSPDGSRGEKEDIFYASQVAIKEAQNAKNEGISIYTIGLGKEIDEEFLIKISSSPENFLLAPATSTLKNVYQKISSSICKEVPARIEITYKIFGDSI